LYAYSTTIILYSFLHFCNIGKKNLNSIKSTRVYLISYRPAGQYNFTTYSTVYKIIYSIMLWLYEKSQRAAPTRHKLANNHNSYNIYRDFDSRDVDYEWLRNFLPANNAHELWLHGGLRTTAGYFHSVIVIYSIIAYFLGATESLRHAAPALASHRLDSDTDVTRIAAPGRNGFSGK